MMKLLSKDCLAPHDLTQPGSAVFLLYTIQALERCLSLSEAKAERQELASKYK